MERLGDRQFPNIFLNNFNKMIFLDINYYSEKKKTPQFLTLKLNLILTISSNIFSNPGDVNSMTMTMITMRPSKKENKTYLTVGQVSL